MKVRRATAHDAPDIAGVHVRTWRAAYRGLVPDRLLEELSIERQEEGWRRILDDTDSFTLVATDEGGHIGGFCAIAVPSRDDDAGERTAEVAATYVEPELWRQGIGTALIAATLDELRRGGWQEVTLWVFTVNEQARSFYRRFGFEPNGAKVQHESLGQEAVRLRAALER